VPQRGRRGQLIASRNRAGQYLREHVRGYPVPLPGSKVFIRAWQQVNGWENRTFARLTSALVPPYARSFSARDNRTYRAKRALH
jgi:hypothetical protein